MKPRYNEALGTMKLTLIYQGKKQKYMYKSWDQQNDLVIRGFCYIRPLYNKVPLYCKHIGQIEESLHPLMLQTMIYFFSGHTKSLPHLPNRQHIFCFYNRISRKHVQTKLTLYCYNSIVFLYHEWKNNVISWSNITSLHHKKHYPNSCQFRDLPIILRKRFL